MGAPTHVCIDCGALGYAGGYHDHGGDSAGDTIPLSSLPTVIRSFQAIETDRDRLRAENERLRSVFERIKHQTAPRAEQLQDAISAGWVLEMCEFALASEEGEGS